MASVQGRRKEDPNTVPRFGAQGSRDSKFHRAELLFRRLRPSEVASVSMCPTSEASAEDHMS